MLLLDKQTIEKLKEKGYKGTGDSFSENLIDIFYEELISKEDKMLIDLAFSENPTQEQLDDFLSNWDIEAQGGKQALLLSYFMKMHPQLSFSNYEKPRLKGLLDFFRFKNLKIIAHFIKIGRALNDANIPLMILKGGAMKYLRPELSRIMGDIDILVNDKDFAKSGEVAKSIGYEYLERNIKESNAIDLHEKGSENATIDIHRHIIYKTEGDGKSIVKDLFERASLEKVFGIETYVPCYEDMLFLALINLSKNLRTNSSLGGILYNLFDARFLMSTKPDFDWSIVTKNAKKTKTQVQLAFAIKFINRMVPNLLPETLQENIIFEKAVHDYCKIVSFERFFFPDFQEKLRDIKITESIKTLDGLKKYMQLKPKYYILKHMRNHPFLIKKLFDYFI